VPGSLASYCPVPMATKHSCPNSPAACASALLLAILSPTRVSQSTGDIGKCRAGTAMWSGLSRKFKYQSHMDMHPAHSRGARLTPGTKRGMSLQSGLGVCHLLGRAVTTHVIHSYKEDEGKIVRKRQARRAQGPASELLMKNEQGPRVRPGG
jgi:hypothetical protein